MWRMLRDFFPEAHFRRQVPIRNFIADFASHALKLVIEIDGGQHSENVDRHRTALIEAEGYRVLRFWNHDVLGNGDGVVTVLAPYCGDATPTPTLPHRGGGS
jgi:very-short-patch-repair endonuclease